MRRVTWLVKLMLTIAAASVGLAAVIAGIVPRVVDILHAHDEETIDLPLLKAASRH